MTKPKRWYLYQGDDGVRIFHSDSGEAIRKPNSKHGLGVILSVAFPADEDLEKFKKRPKKEECVLVSSLNACD